MNNGKQLHCFNQHIVKMHFGGNSFGDHLQFLKWWETHWVLFKIYKGVI